MNTNEIKRELRDLCRKNLDFLFREIFKEYLSDQSRVYNAFIVQENRWNQIKKRDSLGLSPTKEEEERRLSLVSGILELINDLETEDLKDNILDGNTAKTLAYFKDINNEEKYRNLFYLKDTIKSTRLQGTVFYKCHFVDCKFERLSLEKVVFKECIFSNTKFSKMSFHQVEILNCQLEDTSFLGDFSISKSSFFFSNLTNSLFKSGRLVDVDFTNAILSYASIGRDVDLIRPNFTNTDLTGIEIGTIRMNANDFFVCKSLYDTDLPYTIALEIAESRHGERLFTVEQLREYFPDHPVLQRLDEEFLHEENEEFTEEELNQFT